jgi:hypothetical protein
MIGFIAQMRQFERPVVGVIQAVNDLAEFEKRVNVPQLGSQGGQPASVGGLDVIAPMESVATPLVRPTETMRQKLTSPGRNRQSSKGDIYVTVSMIPPAGGPREMSRQ